MVGRDRPGGNRSGSSRPRGRGGGRAAGGNRSQEARLAEIRRQNAADEKRRRAILVTTLAVVAVLVAVTATAIWLAGRDEGEAEAGADPTGLTVVGGDDGDAAAAGVAVGEEGPVQVAVYLDYQCPNCRTYEEAYGGYLEQLEQSEDVTVVYRPIAILDRVTGDGIYSSRSAGAAACVGEAGDDEVFSRFSDLLFAEQPDEADAGTGLSDERLAELAAEAGAGEDVQQCVLDRSYVDWAARSTEAAAEAGVTGTPTVTVDGEVVSNEAGGPPDPEQLQSAIDAALGSTTTEQEN